MKNFLFIAIFSACISSAGAQTTTTTSQTITLTLQDVINISIGTASGTSFLFDNVSAYQNVMTNANASGFIVKSNRAWNVTVKSAAATFTGPASPAPVMPASKLGVRLNGGSSFIGLSTAAVALTTGARGINAFSIDYNANPGFNYDAGTYTLSIIFTATQQ